MQSSGSYKITLTSSWPVLLLDDATMKQPQMMIINFSDWSFLPTLFQEGTKKSYLVFLLECDFEGDIFSCFFGTTPWVPHVEEEKKHVVLFGNWIDFNKKMNHILRQSKIIYLSTPKMCENDDSWETSTQKFTHVVEAQSF